MRVVDTSIWIEWLIDSLLQEKFINSFPSPDQCAVPTIVELELDKWLTREIGETETERVIAYTQLCIVVELDTKLALQAAELHRQYKLATADTIIYATTLAYDGKLLSYDAHFEGLPKVEFIRKV